MAGRYYTADSWPQQYTDAGFPFEAVSRGPPFNADMADRVYNAGNIAASQGYTGGAEAFFGRFNTGTQLNQGATDVLGSHGPNSLHYGGDALDFRTRDVSDADLSIAANSFGQAGIPGMGAGQNHFHLDVKDRSFVEGGSNTTKYLDDFKGGRNGEKVGDIERGQPAGGGPGGTNINGAGAAGAGAGGGGAACAGAGLTALAGIVTGGLLQGLGLGLNGVFGQLTSALNQIPGVSAVTGMFQNATSILGGVGLGSLSIPGFSALSEMGANLIPGLSNVIPGALQNVVGQLTGPLTNIIQNPLGLPSFITQFTAGGNLPGILTTIGNNMVGNFVGGTIANLTSNLGFGSAFSEISRNITGGITEAMGQTFGNGIGGLGDMFRNMDGVVTYGLSSLGNNLGAVAANMIATGNWDTSNLTRLMSPGAIAQQLISKGLGDATGIIGALINNNVPVAGVNNPLYDPVVSKILYGINSVSAINAVKQTFAVTNNISNLGQLTDINRMMPDVASTLPVKSFEGLGQELIKLQVTEAPTLVDIGSAILKLETSKDLNHISQLDTPFHKPSGDLILKTFAFGSGTYGELTAGDVMGTPAGITHNDTIPILIEDINYIHNHPASANYYALIQTLSDTLAGKYTTPPTAGDSTVDPPVPAAPGSIDPPDVGPYTFGSYSTMDAAVAAFIVAVEDSMKKMLEYAKTDKKFDMAIKQVDVSHSASCGQFLREAHVSDLFEVNFLIPEKNTPMKAYLFAKGLEGFAERTGYGQTADLIERLAQDNLYGDAIRATMRQARNGNTLEFVGVNNERLKLPTGSYYRAPIDYMQRFYRDDLPEEAIYTAPVIFPNTVQEIYIINRDAKLFEYGFVADDLTPAEKDEKYYDIQWENNDEINREIGEQIVDEAIERNVVLIGDKIEIINLDKTRSIIGPINDINYDEFTSRLFDIVNKILYGNIGVTKLNNPFFTDEIIYGVAEALNAGDLTYRVGRSLFEKIYNRLNSGDTKLDRNYPDTYGGPGPALNPNIEN